MRDQTNKVDVEDALPIDCFDIDELSGLGRESHDNSLLRSTLLKHKTEALMGKVNFKYELLLYRETVLPVGTTASQNRFFKNQLLQNTPRLRQVKPQKWLTKLLGCHVLP